MKALSLSILIVTLTGCANTDEWRTIDTQRQILVTVAIAADAWSSRNIRSEPDFREVGPIASRVLGSQPSSEEFVVYFTAIAVGSYFISRALPEKWRPLFQLFGFVVHVEAAHHNCFDSDIC